LALIGATAAATAAVVTAGLVLAPTSNADVPAPYFATSNLGSDPHMIPCNDGATAGFCLYTSQDMGQMYGYPGNYYPMRDTLVYFSTNGYSGWTYKGIAFTESQLDSWAGKRTDCVASGSTKVAKSPDVAPNCRAYHLWAPSAVKSGNYYYLFVPDVSDTSNNGDPPGISTSSRISVSRSTSPFGPFAYQGTVTVHGYMSDPDVVFWDSQAWIMWANGDNGTCGGFTTAQLETDMRTTVSQSVNPVTINGLSVLGDCDGAGPKTGPYVEGASLYRWYDKWYLYFAVKPTSTPAECATGVGGPGTANEAIAWATSNNPAGSFTYQGIVMCGSTTEWTNQATFQTLPNGRKIMVYHDSAGAAKERRLHAECVFTNGPRSTGEIVAGVYRQAMNAANGFNDCMAGTNANYYGLHMKDPQYPNLPPIIRAPSGGGGLTANRYAVGPWERYRVHSFPSDRVVIQALSNGKYLCTPNSTTPISASCTDINDPNAQWTRSWLDTGRVTYGLKSNALNRFLSIGSNGGLYASGLVIGDGAVINNLYMGGKSS
jgi:hypothetical protein